MTQNPSDVYDAMPCPDCGSQEMIQTVIQSETVTVDHTGNFEHIEPRDSVDVIEVLCPECDEVVWSRSES